MIGWFTSLSLRERVMIAGAVPLVVLLIAWQFVWQPLQTRRAALTDEIAAYRLITQAALARAADPAPAAAPPPVVPIATRVTQSADSAGLQLRRLAPEAGGLRVTLEHAGFAAMVLWIADLEVAQRVRVAAIEVDRRPEAGVVSARILLEDAR